MHLLNVAHNSALKRHCRDVPAVAACVSVCLTVGEEHKNERWGHRRLFFGTVRVCGLSLSKKEKKGARVALNVS